YLLFAIRRGSVFERIGLRNGDLVVSIDGRAVGDPAEAMATIQALAGASRVTVDVARQPNELATLVYEIR
ncbi:MAG: PDZ domain-containing protein, partial [Candidatus Binatia bacterium]